MSRYKIVRPEERISELAEQIMKFIEPEMRAGNIIRKSQNEIETELNEGHALVAFWTETAKPIGYIVQQLLSHIWIQKQRNWQKPGHEDGRKTED